MSRLKKILTIFAIYISVAGLVTFSLFIHEEALQTTMFGLWPAKDAGQWQVVLTGTDLMEKINLSAKIINYSIGWIQPLAFLSYRAYAKAADFYILSARTEAFAHAPQLFVGREVYYYFYPSRIEVLSSSQYLLTNGRIGIVYDKEPALEGRTMTGILESTGKYYTVKGEANGTK